VAPCWKTSPGKGSFIAIISLSYRYRYLISYLAVDGCVWNFAVQRSSVPTRTRLLCLGSSTQFSAVGLLSVGSNYLVQFDHRLPVFVVVPSLWILVRIMWCCPIDRCRLIPVWLPSREFNGWIMFFQSRTASSRLIRCFTASYLFSLDARSWRRSPVVPTCLHWLHRAGLHPVSYTVQRIWRCTGEAFLSRNDTSQSYGFGFCLDPWKDSWLQHVYFRRFDSSVASSHYRQHCSFVSLATLQACDRRESTPTSLL